MGVQARVVLYAADSSVAERAARAAFDRIAALDAVMSDYRQDSELMRLAARAGHGPVAISRDLFEVLELSQRLAYLSDGAFDVTVAPLVQLWRLARRTGRLPHPDSLSEARKRSGYGLLSLDARDSTATLSTPGMTLDLGGIAKGLAADEALAALRQAGVRRALIEFGGDIVVGDAPPGDRGWKIQAALADRTFTLENAAVSTSGDTQQFVEIDGTRYSHVIDPRTGIGLTHGIAVTVVASHGALSDGLATTLSVMGPDAGRRLIRSAYPDVDAIFRYPSRR